MKSTNENLSLVKQTVAGLAAVNEHNKIIKKEYFEGDDYTFLKGSYENALTLTSDALQYSNITQFFSRNCFKEGILWLHKLPTETVTFSLGSGDSQNDLPFLSSIVPLVTLNHLFFSSDYRSFWQSSSSLFDPLQLINFVYNFDFKESEDVFRFMGNLLVTSTFKEWAKQYYNTVIGLPQSKELQGLERLDVYALSYLWSVQCIIRNSFALKEDSDDRLLIFCTDEQDFPLQGFFKEYYSSQQPTEDALHLLQYDYIQYLSLMLSHFSESEMPPIDFLNQVSLLYLIYK